MSANMRATPPPSSSGRHGSTANVEGSGSAIMSDSSMALKPVIEEPSKPMPPSKASSSCSAWIEKDFSWPRMSVNQSRMKRMPRSWTSALTSSGVVGRSFSAAMGPQPRWSVRSGTLEPAVRPGFELAQRRCEIPAHRRQLILDPRRRGAAHPALDEAARLELLHALGEQPVRQRGHRLGDLGEAHRAALEHHCEDRAGPALAHELDRLVQAG